MINRALRLIKRILTKKQAKALKRAGIYQRRIATVNRLMDNDDLKWGHQ